MIQVNNNQFQRVGLYKHNIESYKKIRASFEKGEDVVGIVHATGTGKSYNALQLALDNIDKKIIYVVPSTGISEHIEKIIEDNPSIDLKRDFPNLKFRTYQSFISLSNEEMASTDCDLLVLDEFHHIGAPVWGARIHSMKETHPNMKVFGMTAYTIRDRGTAYERDMADDNTDELFSRKIVSRYDLCDAMIDGVLPKPIYRSAYTHLLDMVNDVENIMQNLDANTREYQEYETILSHVKRRIHESPSIPTVLRKNIKPNGKYIYFCPPCSEDGVNDIETIRAQAMEWFKEFVPEEDIVFYTSTSDMGKEGKLNRDAFYNDVTLDGDSAKGKLQVMFAINQYNEGVHAPNVDGVIMGRGTSSDIVYFEQLGRALAVRGNTKEMFDELEKHSIEELAEMCKSRDISVKANDTKVDLIEKLIAPVVIDLTNNYGFIKDLETNLSNRIKTIQNDKSSIEHREIKIRDASFDIEIENQDLFEMLNNLLKRLTISWEDMCGYARKYYEHYGHLEVPQKFKTNDGIIYDENGKINLGMWISNQRRYISPDSERGKMLSSIGMRFEVQTVRLSWEETYEYAKLYYEHHGNLEVPLSFKTNDGYIYDENGKVSLGIWVKNQRGKISLDSEKGKMLASIGMRFEKINLEALWEEMYEYAKLYYEHYGDLEVPYRFITNDGYTYDENGKINLGRWISNQRRSPSLDNTRKELLSDLGMRFETKISTLSWEDIYEYAKLYYEYHGDLEVPFSFKTNDGYNHDENGKINLGTWISYQRKTCSIESERGQLLSSMGMRFESKANASWNENYKYAKLYYEHHGNLKIPLKFKTNDGYTYDENGKINLGSWINNQRLANLDKERINLLVNIGMIWASRKNKEEIKTICVVNGIDFDKNKNILNHISFQHLQQKIDFLKSKGIDYIDEKGKLHEIFSMSGSHMKEKYGITIEEVMEGSYVDSQKGWDI